MFILGLLIAMQLCSCSSNKHVVVKLDDGRVVDLTLPVNRNSSDTWLVNNGKMGDTIVVSHTTGGYYFFHGLKEDSVDITKYNTDVMYENADGTKKRFYATYYYAVILSIE